jgi:hypothetical protein
MFYIQLMTVPVYALLAQSAAYNGLRHILFIYPAIAFFAAFGFLSLWQILKNSIQKTSNCFFNNLYCYPKY